MKIVLLTLFALACVHAAEPPPVSTGDTRVAERAVTIELGDDIRNVRGVPTVPITVATGTRVKIVAKSPGDRYAPVKWIKFNGTREDLSAKSTILEIPSATGTDSGSYYAEVTAADGHSFLTGVADVFVDDHEGQRVLNVSARAQLTPAQPSFTCGFTVEPGPWEAMVLVRVVGPSLARFGVTDPIASPQLRVFNSRGVEVGPNETFWFSVAWATYRAGAFPLMEGGGDVAHVFLLRPGAYTVLASNAGSGSGSVLVEIYQISSREGQVP